MTRYSVQPRGRIFEKVMDICQTSSKRVVQKTVEATGDLIGTKNVHKTTRSLKTSPHNNLETNEEILREKYISPGLRQRVIDDLRLMDD